MHRAIAPGLYANLGMMQAEDMVFPPRDYGLSAKPSQCQIPIKALSSKSRFGIFACQRSLSTFSYRYSSTEANLTTSGMKRMEGKLKEVA